MKRLLSITATIVMSGMIFLGLFFSFFPYAFEVHVDDIWWISLIVFSSAAIVVERAFELRNIINPFCFHFFYFVVFNYLSFFFTFQNELFRNAQELFLASSLYLVFFVSGGLLANKKQAPWRRDIRDPTAWADVLHQKETIGFGRIIFFFLVGLGLILFHYLFIVGGIPLFHQDRENFRIISKAGQGQILTIGMTFVFVSAIVALVQASPQASKSVAIKVLVVLCALLLLLSGFREMTFQLLVLGGIVYYLMKGKYPFYRYIVITVAAGLLALGLLGVYRRAEGADLVLSGTADEYLLWALSRPKANNWGLDYIFDEFTNWNMLLHGRSVLIDLKTLLPGYQPNFGFWLKDYFGMTWDGGSMMIGPHGVFYINFGWLGITLLSLVNGFLAVKLYLFFLKKRSKFMLALLLILSVNVVGIDNVQGIIYAIFMQAIVLRAIHARSVPDLSYARVKEPFRATFLKRMK